jgi:LPS sulfotransferase NodH
MVDLFPIKIDDVDNLIKELPDSDFASAKYDNQSTTPVAIKKLLVILSTQRSGSTYLCDLLKQANICVAHEYFQPYQYMQILADRWDCIEDGSVNKVKYISQLEKYRTSNTGVLGVNLHGNHIEVFESFKNSLRNFKNLEVSYIFLKREDEIAQAVSYEIASQTGKWSSHFNSDYEAKYNFQSISNKLNRIKNQNTLISAYLYNKGCDFTSLSYEKLSSEKVLVLKKNGIEIRKNQDKTIQKQSSSINNEWKKQFSLDLINQSKKESVLNQQEVPSLLSRVKSKFSSVKSHYFRSN